MLQCHQLVPMPTATCSAWQCISGSRQYHAWAREREGLKALHAHNEGANAGSWATTEYTNQEEGEELSLNEID